MKRLKVWQKEKDCIILFLRIYGLQETAGYYDDRLHKPMNGCIWDHEMVEQRAYDPSKARTLVSSTSRSASSNASATPDMCATRVHVA
jgi:hypothetical protein